MSIPSLITASQLPGCIFLSLWMKRNFLFIDQPNNIMAILSYYSLTPTHYIEETLASVRNVHYKWIYAQHHCILPRLYQKKASFTNQSTNSPVLTQQHIAGTPTSCTVRARQTTFLPGGAHLLPRSSLVIGRYSTRKRLLGGATGAINEYNMTIWLSQL